MLNPQPVSPLEARSDRHVHERHAESDHEGARRTRGAGAWARSTSAMETTTA